MIVYKRELNVDDFDNLDDGEELIYYKSDEVAVIIVISNNRIIARKRRISGNELIEEAFLKTTEDVMEFV